MYGEDDWGQQVDEGFSKKLIDQNKKGKYHICPKATHQIAMYNPVGFANILINTFLDKNLEVLEPEKYI